MGIWESDGRPKPFWSWLTLLNLALFVLLVTLFYLWTWFYTDWYRTAITSSLLVTVIPAALGVITKLIPESLLKTWKPKVYHFLVRIYVELVGCARHTETTMVLGGLFGLGLVLGTLLGSVGVRLPKDPSAPTVKERVYWIGRQGSPGGPLSLLPEKEARYVFWTIWGVPARVRVKIKEYPEQTVSVYPWHRHTLTVPLSFYRRVVLLRPTATLNDLIHNNPSTLLIKVGSRDEQRVEGYNGAALWIGCDGDVAVPEALRRGWAQELASRPTLLESWSTPQTLAVLQPALPEKGDVRVQLTHAATAIVIARKTFAIAPLTLPQDFIQEEVLDALP